MEPVVFHPKDDVSPVTKTEEKSAHSTSSPDVLTVSETASNHLKILPSLEIPAGTKGKIPKSYALITFIKTLITTYIIALAVGLIYAIILGKP